MAKAAALWWSPVLAGFIGAFSTHLITQSREREKWIVDCKKQEYRELLYALSSAYTLTRSYISGTTQPLNKQIEARDESYRVFSDRIYIVKDVNLDSLLSKWQTAVVTIFNQQQQSSAKSAFDTTYKTIRDEIVAAANLVAPKTVGSRLLFWKD